MIRPVFVLNNDLSVERMPWHSNGLTLLYPFLHS